MSSDGLENGTLTPKQDRAALALAGGRTNTEAARESGASVRTITRWQTLPAFTRRIDALRDQMTSTALGRLTDGLTIAAVKIHWLTLNARSEQTQLAAARSLMEFATRLRAGFEFRTALAEVEVLVAEQQARIADLEKRLEARGRRP
jgi:hypothetical protein